MYEAFEAFNLRSIVLLNLFFFLPIDSTVREIQTKFKSSLLVRKPLHPNGPVVNTTSQGFILLHLGITFAASQIGCVVKVPALSSEGCRFDHACHDSM